MKIIRLLTIYFLIFVLGLASTPFVFARSLVQISDQVTTSRPGFPANHTIIFKTTTAVPPGGRIKISPQPANFYIPSELNYLDIDFATSDEREGGYTERNLFLFPTISSDGVSVISGTANPYIQITLRNNLGILAGEYVRIKIGDIANHEIIGEEFIYNPNTVGSYKIKVETLNTAGSLIDYAEPMIAIIEPVKIGLNMPKIRSRGAPSGTLAFGTISTIISVGTNYEANCRYSTSSSTPYALMTETFSYTGNFFHSRTLSNLSGGFHVYFVRCRDNFGVSDNDDYIIYFYIESEIDGGEGSGDGDSTTTYDGTGGVVGDGTGPSDQNDGGSGGGSGGGGGGGGGGSFGNLLPYDVPPGDPAVSFSGFAYPNSRVSLMIDGVLKQSANANSGGTFNLNVDELPRGVYTFGLWASDPEGKRSLTYSTTFYVEQGTKSSVSDIFISPTINTNINEINPGDSMALHGYGVSNTFTEVWFYPELSRNLREEEIIKQQIDINSIGLWNIILNTTGAFGGQYKLKARSHKEGMGYSEFSDIISIGVGERVKEKTAECANGDLNGDGKVNITDFSIMLYHWGTNNACADQNSSGKVDLTDFSIMMFYWTG